MRMGLFGYSCAAAAPAKSVKAKIARIFFISLLLVEDLVASTGQALRDDILTRLRALAGALGAAHHHAAATDRRRVTHADGAPAAVADGAADERAARRAAARPGRLLGVFLAFDEVGLVLHRIDALHVD